MPSLRIKFLQESTHPTGRRFVINDETQGLFDITVIDRMVHRTWWTDHADDYVIYGLATPGLAIMSLADERALTQPPGYVPPASAMAMPLVTALAPHTVHIMPTLTAPITAGPWTPVPSSGVTSTTFSFVHPAISTTTAQMAVAVRDANATSVTATSNDFAVVPATTGVPGAPTSLTGASPSTTSVNLKFSPPTSGSPIDAGGYHAQYKRAVDGSYTVGPFVPVITPGHGTFVDSQGRAVAITAGGQITFNGAWDGVSANVVIVLQIDTALWHMNNSNNWYVYPWGTPTTTSPLQGTGVTFTSLLSGILYDVGVYASNVAGNGPVASIQVTTQGSTPPPPPPPPAAGSPGALTSLASPSQTNTSITLTWLPASGGGVLDGGVYQVQYKLTSTNVWTNGPTFAYCTPGFSSFIYGGSTITVTGDGHMAVNTTPDMTTQGVIFALVFGADVWQLNNIDNLWYYGTIAEGFSRANQASSPFQSPGATITGLSNATTYNCQAFVTNSSGTGPAVSLTQATAVNAPPPPPPTPPPPPPPPSGYAGPDQATLDQLAVDIHHRVFDVDQDPECFSGTCYDITFIAGVDRTPANQGAVGADVNGDVWSLTQGTGAGWDDPFWFCGVAKNGVEQWNGFDSALRLMTNGHVWMQEAKGGGWADLTAGRPSLQGDPTHNSPFLQGVQLPGDGTGHRSTNGY